MHANGFTVKHTIWARFDRSFPAIERKSLGPRRISPIFAGLLIALCFSTRGFSDDSMDKFEAAVRYRANLVRKDSAVVEKYFKGKWWASRAYVQKWTAGLASIKDDSTPEYERMREDWFLKMAASVLSKMSPSVKPMETIDPIEHMKVYNFWFSMPDSGRELNEERKNALKREIYQGLSVVNPYPDQNAIPIGEGDDRAIKQMFVGLMKWYEAYAKQTKPKKLHEDKPLPEKEVDKYFSGEAGVLFQHFVSVIREEGRTQKVIDLFKRKFYGEGEAELGVWKNTEGETISTIQVLPDDDGQTKLWIGLTSAQKKKHTVYLLFHLIGMDGELLKKVPITTSSDKNGWEVNVLVPDIPAKKVGALEISSNGK